MGAASSVGVPAVEPSGVREHSSLRVDRDDCRARKRRVPILGRARKAQRALEPRVVVAGELGEIGSRGRIRRRQSRAALREKNRGVALLRAGALAGAAQPELAEQAIRGRVLSRQRAQPRIGGHGGGERRRRTALAAERREPKLVGALLEARQAAQPAIGLLDGLRRRGRASQRLDVRDGQVAACTSSRPRRPQRAALRLRPAISARRSWA